MRNTTIWMTGCVCLSLFAWSLAQQPIAPETTLEEPPRIELPRDDPDSRPRLPTPVDSDPTGKPTLRDRAESVPQLVPSVKDPRNSSRILEPERTRPGFQVQPPAIDSYNPTARPPVTYAPGVNVNPGNVNPASPDDPLVSAMKQIQRVRQVVETTMVRCTREELEEIRKIRQLRTQLKAEQKQRQQAAADQLRMLLEKKFDRDMEQRAKQLANLENTVARLKNAYGERKKARDEIVEYRLQGMVMEAKGLEYPLDGARGTTSVGRPSGVGTVRAPVATPNQLFVPVPRPPQASDPAQLPPDIGP